MAKKKAPVKKTKPSKPVKTNKAKAKAAKPVKKSGREKPAKKTVKPAKAVKKIAPKPKAKTATKSSKKPAKIQIKSKPAAKGNQAKKSNPTPTQTKVAAKSIEKAAKKVVPAKPPKPAKPTKAVIPTKAAKPPKPPKPDKPKRVREPKSWKDQLKKEVSIIDAENEEAREQAQEVFPSFKFDIHMDRPVLRQSTTLNTKVTKALQDKKSVDGTRYSDKDLKEFETLINDKLKQAKLDLEELRASLTHGGDNSTDDTAPTFKMMEDGSETMSREEIAQLASRQEKFIVALENALLRIQNKTYGICRVTGKLIPKERLRLVPHATLSIEAKNMQ